MYYFTTVQPKERNFTPSSLIIEWCKEHLVKYEHNRYGQLYIYPYGRHNGAFKYLAWEIEHLTDTTDKVTIKLQRTTD